MVTDNEMELIRCLIDEVKGRGNPSEFTIHVLSKYIDIDIVDEFFRENVDA